MIETFSINEKVKYSVIVILVIKVSLSGARTWHNNQTPSAENSHSIEHIKAWLVTSVVENYGISGGIVRAKKADTVSVSITIIGLSQSSQCEVIHNNLEAHKLSPTQPNP